MKIEHEYCALNISLIVSLLNPYGVLSENFSFHPRVKSRGYKYFAPREQKNTQTIKNFSISVTDILSQRDKAINN